MNLIELMKKKQYLSAQETDFICLLTMTAQVIQFLRLFFVCSF